MKKSQILGLLTLLAVVGPAALLAEVYVPFASNRSIGGTVYKTKVWVTNIGTAQRTFTNAFMTTGANGSSLTGTGFGTTVAPGATVLLGTLATSGQYGMLEIAGAPQLVVNARIDAISQGATVSSANIPAVSTANAWKAGSVAQVQGLDRVAGSTTSDFGVINLSRDTAQCTIRAFRPDGGQIGNAAIITVLPVSQRHFEDALNTLGAPNVTDARFEASCTKQFYAYALTFRGTQITVVSPSQTTDAILVPIVGQNVVVSKPGTFFTAKDGASTIVVDIPAAPDVRYAKAAIDFDVSVNKFPRIPGTTDLGFFSAVYSLRRNDRTLFHGLIVRNALGRTTLDLGVTDDLALGKRDAWKEHTTYHLSLVHDTEARTITYTLSKGGQVIEQLTPHANHLDLVATGGKKLYVDFGSSGIADGAYFPPIGWSYANLQIVLTPAANQ